jgi:FkbM family methyltransferase
MHAFSIQKIKALLRQPIGRVFRLLLVFRAALDSPEMAASATTELLETFARAESYDLRRLEELVPPMRSAEERVFIATLCRDADVLPRVADAGAVMTHDDGTAVQVMHNGIKVLAGGYHSLWMQELIARCKGVHEPQEEVAFAEVMRHLGDDSTMIELGGFWSYYSIWFLTKGSNRRSIVVEPDPAHIETGRINARLNGCQPEFIQAFVGRHTAPPTPFATEDSGQLELPCVSVADLMASRGIDHLNVLHCDAQGIELDILESCQDLAEAGGLEWMVVSTHSHYISGDPVTHQRCMAWLCRFGATILIEHDVHESFSGDGLIVAKFGPIPAGWNKPRITLNRYSTSLFRNPLYDLASDVRPWRR